MYSGPLSTRIVPGFPRHSMWRRVRKRSGGSFPRRRIKAPDHTLSRQGKVDLYAQPFAVEVIKHVQQPERTAIHCPAGECAHSPRGAQPVGHEIHGLGHIGRVRDGQHIGFVPFQPIAGLDPQVQFQRAVNPVNAFVVPCPRHCLEPMAAMARPFTLRRCRKPKPNPRVLPASVNPTSRSPIASFPARSFGPWR